eukprot:638872-Pleurochrysis_carterae.AAC.1
MQSGIAQQSRFQSCYSLYLANFLLRGRVGATTSSVIRSAFRRARHRKVHQHVRAKRAQARVHVSSAPFLSPFKLLSRAFFPPFPPFPPSGARRGGAAAVRRAHRGALAHAS